MKYGYKKYDKWADPRENTMRMIGESEIFVWQGPFNIASLVSLDFTRYFGYTLKKKELFRMLAFSHSEIWMFTLVFIL